MKKNFLTAIAMMVAAFFVGTEFAQAADVSFSGQLRHRYESEEHKKFDSNQEAHDATGTRVRLITKVNANSDTSAFVSLQSTHTWGNNTAGLGNNADTSVGIHESYFTLKNFAGLGLTAKVGRQQVVMDGHRLYGHTGWADGAQTHDAARFTHAHGNTKMTYVMSEVREDDGNKAARELDVRSHLLHTNFQGVLGGNLSTYVVYVEDECGTLDPNYTTNCQAGKTEWITLGGRQVGKMFGLDYRAEAYWQVGDAGGAYEALPDQQVGVGEVSAIGHPRAGYSGNVNRNAYMFGVRVGKSFANLPMKPKITLWYDYLSGNDDESVQDGEWAQFDTLYDTGHKFYGFQDRFGNAFGRNTNYMGLQDIAIKLVLKPKAKWTLKADLHNFHLASSMGANPDMATMTGVCDGTTTWAQSPANSAGEACRSGGTQLGSELDLTLVHAYNPNVKIVFGYSQFMSESLYHSTIGSGNQANGLGNDNTADWMYVMADMKF